MPTAQDPEPCGFVSPPPERSRREGVDGVAPATHENAAAVTRAIASLTSAGRRPGETARAM